MQYLKDFISAFWNITVEMAPWLLLGLLFAGILHVFLPKQYIQKKLGGKGVKSIIKAVLLGVPLPLCSCGVLPTAIHLYKNGASKSTTNAFLISTPQTGIDSILATYALLGFPFALVRPIMAFLSGVFGGVFTSLFEKEENATIHIKEEKIEKEKIVSFSQKVKSVFKYGLGEMLEDIAKWLLIGLVLAGIFSVIIPNNFFTEIVSNYYSQLIIILLLSLPLYVCATGSIPIALVLLSKGLDPSLVILFLMIGPASNIASVVLIVQTMGKKTFILYLLSLLLSALFFTLFIHYTIPKEWFLKNIVFTTETHSHSGFGWGSVAALVLLFLIGRIYILKLFSKKNIVENDIELEVDGMSCNNCKTTIEKELSYISGVKEVQAVVDKNKVYISGNPSIEKVKEKIIDLGFSTKK